ncbi:MFS transporter [Escherichia coli]|uniref:MFS transporter n=1 Tax=Escherichia coli TaxID=562 RepID=UPI00388DB461
MFVAAVGWALCASIVGIMFTINNQFVFWLGSGCALILAPFLLFFSPKRMRPLQPRLPMR